MKNKPAIFSGPVYELGPMKKINESFYVRTIVITEKIGSSTKYIQFTACNDQIDYIDTFKVKDIVEIQYNIKGEKGNNGKYYNNLMVVSAKMIEEFKENLFSASDVSIPDSSGLNDHLE